jgi:mycofactocin biosynthesis protein MftB
MACAVSTSRLDLDAAWELHPQVSIRPERFGALLYHFGTRKLSFVTTPLLLRVVELLDTERSARAACAAAGVGPDELATYTQALSTLAASSMICERQAA